MDEEEEDPFGPCAQPVPAQPTQQHQQHEGLHALHPQQPAPPPLAPLPSTPSLSMGLGNSQPEHRQPSQRALPLSLTQQRQGATPQSSAGAGAGAGGASRGVGGSATAATTPSTPPAKRGQDRAGESSSKKSRVAALPPPPAAAAAAGPPYGRPLAAPMPTDMQMPSQQAHMERECVWKTGCRTLHAAQHALRGGSVSSLLHASLIYRRKP